MSLTRKDKHQLVGILSAIEVSSKASSQLKHIARRLRKKIEGTLWGGDKYENIRMA